MLFKRYLGLREQVPPPPPCPTQVLAIVVPVVCEIQIYLTIISVIWVHLASRSPTLLPIKQALCPCQVPRTAAWVCAMGLEWGGNSMGVEGARLHLQQCTREAMVIPCVGWDKASLHIHLPAGLLGRKKPLGVVNIQRKPQLASWRGRIKRGNSTRLVTLPGCFAVRSSGSEQRRAPEPLLALRVGWARREEHCVLLH